MNKVTLQVILYLDGDPDKGYVQKLAENVANSLEHTAATVGLSPDDGTYIERFEVDSLSDPVFKVNTVTVDHH